MVLVSAGRQAKRVPGGHSSKDTWHDVAMSGRRARREKATPEPERDDGLWVHTMPMLDQRGYTVELTWKQDTAWTLTPDQAVAYALTCFDVAQRTEYDAAVFKLLRTLKLDPKSAAEFLHHELRQDRPPVADLHTAPLRFVPGVTIAGKGFVDVHHKGEADGQLSPTQLRGHALVVMEAPMAADLDAGLLRALTGAVGLPLPQAQAVVEDVGRHR
jgi:hypothetical protein